MPSPHEVLGIPPDADPADARAAYHRLVELYHPDRLRHLRPEVQAEGNRRLVEVTNAWQTIVGGAPRPLRAAGHRARPPAESVAFEDHRETGATIHDAAVRSVRARRPVEMRWGGDPAAATLRALRGAHHRDPDAIRQRDWGAYSVILTGDDARAFLSAVLPEAPPGVGPDLRRLIDQLEPDGRYEVSADCF